MTNSEASKAYRDAYIAGKELVSDYAYDAMFDTNEAEIDDVGQGELVDHVHPMLSLPTFFFDVKNITEQMLLNSGVRLTNNAVLSYKLDGVPCSCIWENGKWLRAVTRGKRFKGFVANSAFLSRLPQPMIDDNRIYDFRGEFVISKANFDKLNAELPEDKRYANPRSMVSAQLNSLQPDANIIAHIDWLAHGIWIDNEPSSHFASLDLLLPTKSVCPHSFFQLTMEADAGTLSESIAKFYDNAMNFAYPCDGIVLQHSCTTANNGRCNLDRIAIKQFDEAKYSATTEIERIEWRLANNGSYFPRLWFKPVSINGSTVTHAAAYCWDYVNRLGLSIGAVVTVTMRGGVIPYVSSVQHIGNGDYQLPADAIAPEANDMQLWSSNSNDAVQRLRFIRGMEMLDLKDCGIGLFSDMYDSGYTDLFKVAEQVHAGTFAEHMLNVVLPATEASDAKLAIIVDRFTTFNYVWLILALREPGIGFKAANAIGQYLSGYELRDSRILDSKAVSAVLGNAELIAKVKQYSKPVAPEHADLSIVAKQSNKPKVCMSKKPSNGMKKAEFAATYLADYDITDNIKEAQLLVCPLGEQSNKIAYAHANNIEIKHYEDFLK